MNRGQRVKLEMKIEGEEGGQARLAPVVTEAIHKLLCELCGE